MSLDNETGLDIPGIRVRSVTCLVAADYFVPGYFFWAVLIASLARIGYEEKTMYMVVYDWRLSFQNTEVLFLDGLIQVNFSQKSPRISYLVMNF
jgi:phospholipid:diacylglycerol acyltransferase